MNMDILKKSLENATIVNKADYQYVIHPLTDGIPEIKPNLLEEVTNKIFNIVKKYDTIDKIVTIEAMGIPLASVLSLKMNIPFSIIRKRKYGLKNEVCVQQETGYSKSKLYLNGFKSGEKIIIVDDVLSTGGTLKTVLKTLFKIGVIVKCVVIVIDKGDSVPEIIEKNNIDIYTITKISVKNGKLIIRKI
jgi:adenine phosphoribosyltransferase